MPTTTDRTAVLNLLRTVPLFSSLDSRHLKTLSQAAVDRTYNPGDLIVPQGEKGIGFYLVAEGQVAVEKSGKTVATLGPGQFFGEMALIDEQPRTASVKAVSKSRCYVLSSWEFWGSVAKDPEALRTLLRETVRRLRSSAPAPED
jgi:CRP/FNR family transcriptional regulator